MTTPMIATSFLPFVEGKVSSLDLIITVTYIFAIASVGYWLGIRHRRKHSSGDATPTASTPEPKRYVWVTGLSPEKAAYYEDLHANPWPEVSEQITESNIQNFSIHKREIDGKLYLIAYLEYVGDDFEADMAKMAEDEATQRWWAETDPCQAPLPDAAAKGVIWSDTEEVFFQK